MARRRRLWQLRGEGGRKGGTEIRERPGINGRDGRASTAAVAAKREKEEEKIQFKRKLYFRRRRLRLRNFVHSLHLSLSLSLCPPCRTPSTRLENIIIIITIIVIIFNAHCWCARACMHTRDKKTSKTVHGKKREKIL